ncbi:MAG: dipeptidase [Bacteroidetes bacterium]|nr:dipeptidase [Bacteroidota bacterium]
MGKTLFFIAALGLSAATGFSQSYEKIHRDAIVADTHNDVITTASMKHLPLDSDLTGKTHSDIGRLRKAGVDVQVFSIFCNELFGKDTAFKYANIEIDSLYAVAKRNPGTMAIVKTPAQLERAVAQHKLACMMGVEGGHMIEDRIDYLDQLYKRGVRYMTLTWNNSTSWASSAKDESQHILRPAPLRPVPLPHPPKLARRTKKKAPANQTLLQEDSTKGLTYYGRQIVRHMNKLGMMVDLSHVGEQTFWDVIAITKKPVLVSHSCVYDICPVFRNLKDEQILAVGRNGGVIDINFYSGFLDSNYFHKKDAILAAHKAEIDSLKRINTAFDTDNWFTTQHKAEAEAMRPPLSLLLDHIDYIVDLIGVDHVGIGSDFDGIESTPKEINDVTDLPLLTKGLLERGYSATDIKKMLGGNFIRVFKANAPPPKKKPTQS